MLKIILISFILNLTFCVFYLKLNSKNYLNFLNYFLYFITYCLVLYIIFHLIGKNFPKVSNNQVVVFVILYILFFISFFLSVSSRYITSPSYLIFIKLQNNDKNNLIDLVNFFRKKKVLEMRIKDLKRQKIIEFRNGSIILKKNIGYIIYIIFLIKKFYKLKSEG